jgi:hypothetical protein
MGTKLPPWPASNLENAAKLHRHGIHAKQTAHDGKVRMRFAKKAKRGYGTRSYQLILEDTLGTFTLFAWAVNHEPQQRRTYGRRASPRATARHIAPPAGLRCRGDTCQANFEVPSSVRRQLAGSNRFQAG